MSMFVRTLLFGLCGLAAGTTAAAADLQTFQSQGAPGLCLSLEVGAVAIRPCDDGVTQSFRLLPTFKRDGVQFLIGNTGLMMGAENQMLTSKVLGGSEQSTAFTVGSDGSISAGGLCLDVKGGSRRAGTPVIAFRGNGQTNQRGTAAPSAGGGVDPRIAARKAQVSAKLSPKHAPGACLGADNANRLVLQACADAPLYDLTTGGRSTALQLQGSRLCITPPGVSGQPLELKGCANEASQVWGLSDTGLLRSQDGLCADVKSSGKTPGTPVIAFACSGDQNQRYSLVE